MTHSRREFVRQTAAGLAIAALSGAAVRNSASAQTSLTPEAALQQLMDGNRRFGEGRMNSFDEDLNILKAKTVQQQEPFAAVLSCADFACARRIDIRSKHRASVRYAGGRQYCHLSDHRQPRIRCRRPRHKGHHGARTRQLRRGQGIDRSEGGSWTDQRPLFLYSPRRRPGRRQSRGRDQG